METQVGILCSVSLVILGIAAVLLGLILRKHFRLLKFMKKHNVPYRTPLPVIGNWWPLITKQISFAEFNNNLYREFPDDKYSVIFEFTTPIYLLHDLELIKNVMVKYFDHFPNHRDFVDPSIDIVGGNLFALKGNDWREMRSIVSPVFTSSKMRAMFELMSKCSDDLADYLAKQPHPMTLEMKEIFTRYSSNVIATTAFGVTVNSLENQNDEFYLMGKELTTFRIFQAFKAFLNNWNPAMLKFFKLKLFSKHVTKFFLNLVTDTISTRQKNGIIRLDLIHQLMHAKRKESAEKLTMEEITAQAVLFFFAGLDTATSLMSFASHQLAVHPDLQEKLIAELDAAFDEEGDKLSYEKVNNLPYFEMFLNETLRCYSPVIITDRVNTREFKLPAAKKKGKSIRIKSGSRIWIPIYGLNHDAQYFPDPEKFDPERFSPENRGNINPYAFLPFGAGPRNCPGNRFALMETKLVLLNILRKFRFRVGAKTKLPLVLKPMVPTMGALHGFWLDLEPREFS